MDEPRSAFRRWSVCSECRRAVDGVNVIREGGRLLAVCPACTPLVEVRLAQAVRCAWCGLTARRVGGDRAMLGGETVNGWTFVCCVPGQMRAIPNPGSCLVGLADGF